MTIVTVDTLCKDITPPLISTIAIYIECTKSSMKHLNQYSLYICPITERFHCVEHFKVLKVSKWHKFTTDFQMKLATVVSKVTLNSYWPTDYLKEEATQQSEQLLMEMKIFILLSVYRRER